MALFILKLIVGISVLVVIVMTVNFVNKRTEALKPEISVVEIKQELEAASTSEAQIGDRIFSSARQLLATSDLEGARTKLLRIVNFYPTAPSVKESQRILGEMKIDELFSLSNMTNKVVYKVKPGEGYTRVVRNTESSLEMIMFLNGLTSLTGLQPGDELLAMPLHFRLVIKPYDKRVELWSGEEFVKSYHFVKVSRGMNWRAKKTSISSKAAYRNERRYLPRDGDHYRQSSKVMRFKGIPLELRTFEKNIDDDEFQAIFLSKIDMEELSMIMRLKNDVVIRLDEN